MARIEVREEPAGGGWRFEVTVTEDDSSTRHAVTLSREDYRRLSRGGEVPPAELVRKSFVFLLDREPKESILSSFDLTLIGRYFPEYESKI